MKIFWMVLKLLKAGIDLIIRDYYMTFSISALVSTRDSHIKPEVFFSFLFFDILCLTPLHRHRKLNSGTNIDIWRQILLLTLRTNNQHWLPAIIEHAKTNILQQICIPANPPVLCGRLLHKRRNYGNLPLAGPLPRGSIASPAFRYFNLQWPAFVFLWIFHYCQ